jgi:predicted  nucleic acid-binding Zn-ribbon protein
MPAKPPTLSPELLRTLHHLHRQLSDLRERLNACPRRVQAAETGVTQREKELADLQVQLKKLRMAADEKQLQLRSNEERTKDLNRKLMTATSNREYQALKEQIAADEMANSVLADEILEAFEKIDQMHVKIEAAEKALAAARQRAATARAEAQSQEPALREELQRVQAELGKLERALPAEIAELYQRVVRHRGEDALASVENEVCGGCYQHVPINLISQIKLGQPVFCKTCGRLLYLPPGS